MQRTVLDRLCEVHVTPWTASSMCQLKVKHVEHGVQDVADGLQCCAGGPGDVHETLAPGG